MSAALAHRGPDGRGEWEDPDHGVHLAVRRLAILDRETKRVPKGRAIVIPTSDKTRGHGSHTVAALWKDELIKLLKETEQNQ